MGVIISVVLFLLLLGALADIITSDQSRIRHLPKLVWIVIVILIPLIGSLLWFVIGHDYSQSVDRGSFGDPRRREQPAPMGMGTAPEGKWPRNSTTLSTEQELAALEREIAADRIRQLEAEVEAKRRAKGVES